MRILRKLLMVFGLLFIAAGAISSFLGELTGFVAFSGLQNLLISCMGVVIFWLSLERVHPEGYKFFLIFIALSSLLGFFYFPLGILGFLLTIFVLWFFRDPERAVPLSEAGIISPADGIICR